MKQLERRLRVLEHERSAPDDRITFIRQGADGLFRDGAGAVVCNADGFDRLRLSGRVLLVVQSGQLDKLRPQGPVTVVAVPDNGR